MVEFSSHFVYKSLHESRFQGDITCAKVNKELKEDDLEELGNFQFKEFEGERSIKDDPINNSSHLKPLKLCKHDIGIEDKPKLASISDYWDEQTTKEIFDVLKEYEYLFPVSFS